MVSIGGGTPRRGRRGLSGIAGVTSLNKWETKESDVHVGVLVSQGHRQFDCSHQTVKSMVTLWWERKEALSSLLKL